MENQTSLFIQALQLAGWALTLLGQIQIGNRGRGGFVTWVVANLVMTGIAVHSGLYWSIGMYATNIVSCCWSYRRWGGSRPEPVTEHQQPTRETFPCN